jgi:glycerate kinase
VAEQVGLPRAIASADAVVTGEGRLDATSLEGKVVGGVLGLAGSTDVAVLAGTAESATAQRLRERGVVVLTLRELSDDDEQSYSAAAELLRRAAAIAGDRLLRSRPA